MASSLGAAIDVVATGGVGRRAGGSKKELRLGLVPLRVIEVKSKEASGMVLPFGLRR